MSDAKRVKGEGNYEAAETFNKAQREFVKSGKADKAAAHVKPKSQAEAEELKRAEEEARRHAKGEDPTIKHSPSNQKSG